jgi:hypothetical protein
MASFNVEIFVNPFLDKQLHSLDMVSSLTWDPNVTEVVCALISTVPVTGGDAQV